MCFKMDAPEHYLKYVNHRVDNMTAKMEIIYLLFFTKLRETTMFLIAKYGYQLRILS